MEGWRDGNPGLDRPFLEERTPHFALYYQGVPTTTHVILDGAGLLMEGL